MAAKGETRVERKGELEVVATRTFTAPARLVFEAWTNPKLFPRWWIPRSFGITVHSCELDVRKGGTYRLMLSRGDSPPMAFFGRYLEVIPGARIVWTNEESGEAGAVTTVTFEEKGGETQVVMNNRYPSKAALDEDFPNGSMSGTNESFEQLEALLREPRSSSARAAV